MMRRLNDRRRMLLRQQPPKRTAPITVLILDEFTGSDGSQLSAHTIAPVNVPAASWSYVVGGFTIRDHAARPVGAAYDFAVCDAGKADVIISAKLTSIALGGIALRISAPLTGWKITGDDADNRLDLFEGDGSAWTLRARHAAALADGITVTVTASGPTISAVSDQGHSISYASATRNQSVTTHGLHGYSDVERIDNFQVQG